MRSALLLAERGDLFPFVRDALVTSEGAIEGAHGESVQIERGRGPALLNKLDGDDWRSPEPTTIGGLPAPDMAPVDAVMIEAGRSHLGRGVGA